MSHQAPATQKPSSIWSLCLATLVVLVLINQLGFCSARYLPTRSDESRKEMIKEMLKELMDMPQTYENDNRYATNGKARFGLAYNPDTTYLNKRSASPDSEALINRLRAKF